MLIAQNAKEVQTEVIKINVARVQNTKKGIEEDVLEELF